MKIFVINFIIIFICSCNSAQIKNIEYEELQNNNKKAIELIENTQRGEKPLSDYDIAILKHTIKQNQKYLEEFKNKNNKLQILLEKQEKKNKEIIEELEKSESKRYTYLVYSFVAGIVFVFILKFLYFIFRSYIKLNSL